MFEDNEDDGWFERALKGTLGSDCTSSVIQESGTVISES